MKDWSVEYQLIDHSVNPRLPVPRTASLNEAKWNKMPVEREVLLFGVARTVPATERRELVEAVGSTFTAAQEMALTATVDTDHDVRLHFGHTVAAAFLAILAQE